MKNEVSPRSTKFQQGNTAAWKSGKFTRRAKAERRAIYDFLRQAKSLLDKVA